MNDSSASLPGPDQIRRSLRSVRSRIQEACTRAGRDPGEVTLIAVTKTVPPERMRVALEDGQLVMGESYVQEWRHKAVDFDGEAVRWHLLGHLQRNKARFVAGEVELIHSVDSLRLAAALDRQDRDQDVLIEVNIAAEETKTGFSPADLREAWADLTALPNVHIRGLMCLPPWSESPEGARPWFRALRELRDELATEALPLPQLSMGMSGDFEVAIEEGATFVRVGSAIFGARL